MSCTSLSLKGLKFNECEANLAGVEAIYLCDDYDGLVMSATTSALTISALSGATFYKYELDEQVGYLTSTASVGDNGRLRYYTNEIRVAFPHLDKEKHAEFVALTHNPVKAIVKDNNGVWHFVSIDKPLRANDGALAQTGQNVDDENGYEIILSGRSAYPSFIIEGDAQNSVIAEPAVNIGG